MDSSVQRSKEYGSSSGAKPSGIGLITSLTPPKPKGKSLFQEDIFPMPKDDSQKILGNSIKEMKNRGNSKENLFTIYRNGKEIKVYVTHTFFHEAKNEEYRRLGLPSLEEQAELIADEADRMQRLKVQAEDEALAIKLQEEEEKGLKKKKGGKKRACSSSRGRRIKRRAGRDESQNVEEEVVHQDPKPEVSAHQNPQPKEEPQDLGEPEQSTRGIHPFSNRIIKSRRPLRTESEKETQIKPAEEKPTPLKMDKVIACKGIRMNRPGQEEIEFELDSKKKIMIPLKQVLKQEINVLKKIYTRLNRNYKPSEEVAQEILSHISKVRREEGKDQPPREVKIWNPEGKRVLLEPMWLMFYHDTQGQVRYFEVEEDMEKASNEELERLIDQLSRFDEEEMRLRRTLESQLRMNKEKT